MPRLGAEFVTQTIGGSGFTFSGVRVDTLGATDYTLVTLMIDVSGSVGNFAAALLEMLRNAILGAKKSPRSDNILVRVCVFSSMHPKGLLELHGFKPLQDIDPVNDYRVLKTGGGTPLLIATFSALGATNAYAKTLRDQDFGVNAILYVITDGCDTDGGVTMQMIADEQERARTAEELESLVTILVGVNDGYYRQMLEDFARDAGFTSYVPVGDATVGRLAKLGGFISHSVSSTAQAQGTGGPSQNINPTI